MGKEAYLEGGVRRRGCASVFANFWEDDELGSGSPDISRGKCLLFYEITEEISTRKPPNIPTNNAGFIIISSKQCKASMIDLIDL